MNPPRLTISDLKIIGLLGATAASVQVVAEGITLSINWYPEHKSLSTVCVVGGTRRKCFIEVVWEPVGEGEAAFFVCANTGKSVTSIYFDDYEWSCRTWPTVARMFLPVPRRFQLEMAHDKKRLRLLGQDGRAPPRGKRRSNLVGYFRPYSSYVGKYPELVSVLEYEASRIARKPVEKARAASRDAMRHPNWIEEIWERSPAAQLFEKETSFKKASMANYPMARLAGTQAAAGFNRTSSALRQNRFEDWFKTIPPLPSRAAERKLEFVEETPVLDARDILWDGLSDTKASTFALEWPIGTSTMRVTCLAIRTGNMGYWLYLQHDSLIRPAFRQVLRIEINATGKRLFICPFKNQRFTRLFYRDSCFASQHAQRLTYHSQRKI